MEDEGESGVLVNTGHPGPVLMRETVVESLEESADLVFICFCPRKDYDCFAKVEGRAGCRFLICQLVIFGDVSRELLSKEIPLQMLVHMGV
jgi:hypothetical protein